MYDAVEIKFIIVETATFFIYIKKYKESTLMNLPVHGE